MRERERERIAAVMGFQSTQVMMNSSPDPQSNDLDLSLDFEVLDDKSLYEEIAKCGGFLTREELENCCQLVEVHPDDPFCDLEEVHGWKTRIDRTSHRLHIHPDPHKWSPQEVLIWCLDTLRDLNHLADLSTIAGLTMDGTTLCMLMKEDFKARAPLVGEVLHAELAIWKSAGSLPSLLENWDSSYRSSIESAPTFLDLDTTNSQRRHEPTSSPPPRDVSITSSELSSDFLCVYSSASSPGPSSPGTREGLLGPRNPLFSEAAAAARSSRSDLHGGVRETVSHHNKRSSDSPVKTPTQPLSAMSVDFNRSWPNREHRHSTHLWQFLKELLNQPDIYEGCIRWTDHRNGIFRIEDSSRVAKLWGERKHRPAMNYDKLSRSIRQYYKKGIIRKTQQSKRLVYQFCPQYL